MSHRQVVVVRRAKFDLAKAEARAHIFGRSKNRLDHIEQVIKTIRASKDKRRSKSKFDEKVQVF
ncbi:MAG: hypothetical protein R3B39_02290 [Candidatus Paceibacterota bacterium]